MKRFVCVCFALILFALPAFADTPNANLIREYKKAIIGEWETDVDYTLDMGIGLSLSLELTEEDYGRLWTLFASSDGVVYFATIYHHKAGAIAVLTLDESGKYMMLYREGIGGAIYRRKK